jgi:Domain of unknown function (DUF4129)
MTAPMIGTGPMIGSEPAGAQPGPASPAPRAAAQARVARILLVALLTALAAAGLRGHIRLHGQAAPYQGDGIAVGAILEAVLAVLLAALLIRGRRAPAAAVLAARLRGILRPLLITGLIAIPVVLVLAVPLRTHSRPRTLPHQPGPTGGPAHPSARPAPHGSTVVHIPLSAVLYALLVIVLIAGIVVCAVVLRRRQPAVSYPEAAPDAGAQRAGLQAAVESGRSALRAIDDAQAAIIACYLSMEQSLAGAGAARDAADSPDELLARAAGAGLIRGAAATRLTGLFCEARFSSHRLGPHQRDAARAALRDLADDLARGPARETPAGEPPAGPPPPRPGGRQ